MTKTGQALFQFFSSFGIPAYEVNSVPDNNKDDSLPSTIDLPYITFDQVDSDWRDPVSVSATVWYKSTSLSELFAKVDEIKKKVGEGYSISVDGGVVYIYKDNPFSQVQDSGDDTVKAEYLLFQVTALCN